MATRAAATKVSMLTSLFPFTACDRERERERASALLVSSLVGIMIDSRGAPFGGGEGRGGGGGGGGGTTIPAWLAILTSMTRRAHTVLAQMYNPRAHPCRLAHQITSAMLSKQIIANVEGMIRGHETSREISDSYVIKKQLGPRGSPFRQISCRSALGGWWGGGSWRRGPSVLFY